MHIRGAARQLNFTLVMIRPGRKIDFSHSTAHIPVQNKTPKLFTKANFKERLISIDSVFFFLPFFFFFKLIKNFLLIKTVCKQKSGEI